MQLFIIRHAPAIPASETLLDAARPLTEEGEQRFERAVRGLERLGVSFDYLYHSPWLRAVQTASLLQRLVETESRVSEHLAVPPAPPLLEAIQGERAALVGHEPWLSELAAWLMTGNAGQGTMFELKKGAVLWLEGELAPGKMVLHALFTPKVLRAAGR